MQEIQEERVFNQIRYLDLFLYWFFFFFFYTFADLAVPVFVGGTVCIIPLPPVVSIDFCTVFSVIVIVWLAKTPVFKVRLDILKSMKFKLFIHLCQMCNFTTVKWHSPGSRHSR